MPYPRHHGTLPDDDDEAPSPRLPAGGCYGFLRAPASSCRRGGGGYRRLDSVAAVAARTVRVEVGTTKARRAVFDVDLAVLEAEPVRRLMEAAGRRVPGGGAVAVAVAVDAMLFEHLLWLATTTNDDGGSAADLSEIVEFYSQEEDDDGHGFKC